MKRFSWLIIVSIAFAATSTAQHTSIPNGLWRDYEPAWLPTGGDSANFPVVIFPRGRQESRIAVPFDAGRAFYARDGRSVITISDSRSGSEVCIQRIDLEPVRLAARVCPTNLRAVFDASDFPDEDHVLIAAQKKDIAGRTCGLFEVSLQDGRVTTIVDTGACGSPDGSRDLWNSLSLAPDGSHAVAIRNQNLEIIDLTNGTSHHLGGQFVKARWSPDGRWIAALKRHGGTVLFDAADFHPRKTLPESEVEWSPDSRYLLQMKGCFFPLAVNGVATLAALDIQSGTSAKIESSNCKVDTTAIGWVRVRIQLK